MVAPALPGAQAAINIIKCGIERLEIVKQNQDMAQHLLKNVNEQQDELEADIDRLKKQVETLKQAQAIGARNEVLGQDTRRVEEAMEKCARATKDLVVVLFRAGGQLPEVLNRDNKKVIKQKLLDFCKAKTVAKALDALKEELHEAAWSYDKRKGALISRYGNLKERLEEQSQASGPQAKTSTKPTVHASLGRKATITNVSNSNRQKDTPFDSLASNTTVRKLLQEPASIDPDVKRHLKLYHPGTRQWVFDKVDSWLFDEDETSVDKKTYWVNGMGGLGKSVIAAEYFRRCRQQTAAASSAQPRLAAVVGFFCRHNDATLNDPRRAVVSLAYQLSQQVKEFETALLADKDRVAEAVNAANQSLRDLFEVLIQQPMKATSATLPILLVLDALDELQHGMQRTQLLNLIGRSFPQLPGHVKVLVTSRPETDITNALNKLNPLSLVSTSTTSADSSQSGSSSEAQQNAVFTQTKEQQDDVRKYLADCLAEAPYFQGEHAKELSQQELDALLSKTQGVFLSARLMVQKALELETDVEWSEAKQTLEGAVKPVEAYRETLNRIDQRLKEHCMREKGGSLVFDEDRYDTVRRSFQTLLDVLVYAEAPLCKTDVVVFCSVYSGQRSSELADFLLSALSLMFTEMSGEKLIEPIHKTVIDFLKNADDAGDFACDGLNGWLTLARASARVLALELPKQVAPNVYDILHATSSLKHALLYGHIYLGNVVKAGDEEQKHSGTVDDMMDEWRDLFLTKRINPQDLSMCATDKNVKLFESEYEATFELGLWLLAQSRLSETRKYRFVVELTATERFLQGRSPFEVLHDVLKCTRKLYASFAVPAETIASGLALFLGQTPLRTSLFNAQGLRAAFGHRQLMQVPRAVAISTSPLEAVLQGHSESVTSVCYSPDGKTIVSGSEDWTVRVWDAASGSELHTLQGHLNRVTSVCCSPDGKTIVSGSKDETVRMWDAASGNFLQALSCSDHLKTVSSTDQGRLVLVFEDNSPLLVHDPLHTRGSCCIVT
eukprot:TRINITY_DN12550_c0_g3_i3.p1 TRINITY_DN12550_c0_g3~~TRINITY_DN12550_c0_g3_i3.p1  ORF type:complete len:1011 (+),score=280.44 TRINITY_DN12550_c0_g3_i3:330-3362(+)